MLVETTGNFMLLDPFSRVEIESEGTTKVEMTPFIKDRIELGQLRVIEAKPAPVTKAK